MTAYRLLFTEKTVTFVTFFIVTSYFALRAVTSYEEKKLAPLTVGS
jgi:hypothetical protein